ncbi:hypothetical protein F2Q69_00003253 [Brassica cretica]|uniref:NPH3 domain-containing protein n=1 Tax=Brassica cretica TaxID=69181 RepID=A0A8S9P770_BRACR|nr:hypothetical protein F2Q69_00003253 [Brassica cretica]
MDSCIPWKTGELRVHQKIDKTKRKRLCRILDCKKLSVDTSKNAALSQLLPLRVMEEVLATGLLEDNPLAELSAIKSTNNDSSYGTHGIMVTLRIESLFDGLLHSMENWRATGPDHKVLLATNINPKIVGVDASKNAAQSQLLPVRVMVHIFFDGASTSCDIYNNKRYITTNETVVLRRSLTRRRSFEKKLNKKKKMINGSEERRSCSAHVQYIEEIKLTTCDATEADECTSRPPGVKADKAHACKEMLSKMSLLDRLIAKEGPLNECEEVLKKKLIDELLDV